MPTREEIVEKLSEIIAKLNLPGEKSVKDESKLMADLGLDDLLDIVDLIVSVEEEWKIQISNEDLDEEGMYKLTFGMLVDIICKKLEVQITAT